MNVAAKKHILAIAPYQPGKPIEELKRELGLTRVIKLASNESPYPPAPGVLRAVRAAAGDLNRYPDDDCFDLRRALARKCRVKPDQLIFGSGSDEIIYLAVRTFVGAGDEVVIASPSFLIYSIAPQIEDAKLIRVPLQGFAYDLEAMLRAVTERTRLIFIGNPDNPAGTYVSARSLEDFLRRVPDHVLVFIDEAYYEFAVGGDYPNSLRFLKDFPNVIVARTFSKVYGLAGLRIGYGIASAQIIGLLNRVRPPFNVNSLAQTAALACLRHEGYYRQKLAECRREKMKLARQITALGWTVWPTATNFLLIDVGPRRSQVVQDLLRRGVIVRDMRCWGLERFIRVSIGTPSENQALIKALAQILKGEAVRPGNAMRSGGGGNPGARPAERSLVKRQ